MNKKIINLLFGVVMGSLICVQAQTSEFKKFENAFPLFKKVVVQNGEIFRYSFHPDSSNIYLPAICKKAVKDSPCGEEVFFSYGYKAIVGKFTVLHSLLLCDYPQPQDYPYHNFLISVYTQDGKLVDSTVIRADSDLGFSVVQGTVAPYRLHATYYKNLKEKDWYDAESSYFHLDEQGKIQRTKVGKTKRVKVDSATAYDLMNR